MPFIVPVEIKKSDIPEAGNGVFAKAPIKKGDIVWEYQSRDCIELTENHFKMLNECRGDKSILKNFLMFSYCEPSLKKILFLSDEGRYTNHSETPNCGIHQCNSIALRDIEVGEEIVENYRTYGKMPESIIKLLDEHGIWHV